MIEAKFVLGGLEAFLDAPAGSFDPDQCLDRGALGTPCREIGHITIRGVTPDQQATRPKAGSVFIVFRGVEVSQFTIGPVIKTLAPWCLVLRKGASKPFSADLRLCVWPHLR